MSDPRVSVIDSGRAIVCPYTGKRFPFENPANRDKALDACRQHISAVIARRERIAGRPLTAYELTHGVPHVDLRDAMTRALDSAWRPTPAATEQAEPMHPFDQYDDMTRPKSFRQLSAELRDAFDRRTGRKTLPEKSERQLEAEECARRAWEETAFDSSASLADLERCERLQQQAATGNMDVFGEMYRTHVAASAARESMRRAEIGAQIAQLEQQRLPRFDKSEPEPVPEPPKPKSDSPEHFSRISIELEQDPERRKFMQKSTEEFWASRATRDDGGQQ
jgi:hypothetical protein